MHQWKWNEVQNAVFALWKALLQGSHLSMFYSHLHCLVVALCHKHTVIIHNSPQQNCIWACEGAGNVPGIFMEAGGPQVIYGHHVPVVPQQCTDDLPTSPRQINCPLSPQMGRRHNPSHPMLAAPDVFMFFYSSFSLSPIKEQMEDLSKAGIGGWWGGVMTWNGEEECEGLQLRDVPCIYLSRFLLFSVILWPPKWRVVNGCQVGAGWGEPETGDDRCAG